MNSEAYKALISQKNVLDHTTLNVTLKELASRQEAQLADKIKGIIEHHKIPKPAQHAQPFVSATNYYTVDLEADEMDRIVDVLFGLEESHTGENGEPTPTASFYASLVDKWNALM